MKSRAKSSSKRKISTKKYDEFADAKGSDNYSWLGTPKTLSQAVDFAATYSKEPVSPKLKKFLVLMIREMLSNTIGIVTKSAEEKLWVKLSERISK